LTGPIILVGHSRGGRHIIDAAHELQKSGITIDLLICLDVAAPSTVPGNVRHALNLYLTQHRVYPAEMLKATPGSTTRIDNIDLNAPNSPVKVHGLNHVNLTADAGVQDFVLKAIAKAVGEATDH
jgi:thioesterase domain-containing protein